MKPTAHQREGKRKAFKARQTAIRCSCPRPNNVKKNWSVGERKLHQLSGCRSIYLSSYVLSPRPALASTSRNGRKKKKIGLHWFQPWLHNKRTWEYIFKNTDAYTSPRPIKSKSLEGGPSQQKNGLLPKTQMSSQSWEPLASKSHQKNICVANSKLMLVKPNSVSSKFLTITFSILIIFSSDSHFAIQPLWA